MQLSVVLAYTFLPTTVNMYRLQRIKYVLLLTFLYIELVSDSLLASTYLELGEPLMHKTVLGLAIPELYIQSRRMFSAGFRPSMVVLSIAVTCEIAVLAMAGLGLESSSDKAFNILALFSTCIHNFVEVIIETGVVDYVYVRVADALGANRADYMRRFEMW